MASVPRSLLRLVALVGDGVTCAKCDVRPEVQASFRVLVKVPGEWTPEHMEKLTEILTAAVNSTPARAIELRWSAPGLTRTEVSAAEPLVIGRILPFPTSSVWSL